MACCLGILAVAEQKVRKTAGNSSQVREKRAPRLHCPLVALGVRLPDVTIWGRWSVCVTHYEIKPRVRLHFAVADWLKFFNETPGPDELSMALPGEAQMVSIELPCSENSALRFRKVVKPCVAGHRYHRCQGCF